MVWRASARIVFDGDRSGDRRQDRRGAQKHGRTDARHRGKKSGNQEIDKLRPPIAADKRASGQADKRRNRSTRTHAPHYNAQPAAQPCDAHAHARPRITAPCDTRRRRSARRDARCRPTGRHARGRRRNRRR
ncbi:hypothetical protein EGY20_14770 [Burkholderia multivorans]|nr:hypothetical protein EGY20_14770 [Burkholderia multivorans]